MSLLTTVGGMWVVTLICCLIVCWACWLQAWYEIKHSLGTRPLNTRKFRVYRKFEDRYSFLRNHHLAHSLRPFNHLNPV